MSTLSEYFFIILLQKKYAIMAIEYIKNLKLLGGA